MKKRQTILGVLKLLAATSITFTTTLFAQEFADDFSVDSLKYEVRQFTTDSGSVDYSVSDGVVNLLAENADDAGVSDLRIAARTRSIAFTGRFNVASSAIPDTSFAAATVQAAVFNDTAESDGESEIGDIYVIVQSGLSGTTTNLRVCLGRIDENGFSELPFFEDGNSCREYNASVPAAGDEFTLGIQITGTNTVDLNLNGTSDTLQFPGSLRAPVRTNGEARLEMAASGNVSLLISSITTDSGTDDFSQQLPVLNRYILDDREDSVALVDEELQINTPSTDGTDSFMSLGLVDVTDYLEATLRFDSASTLEGNNPRAGVGGQLEFGIANDIQDGGTDERLGDIRADLRLDLRRNGLRRALYCLFRIDDAEDTSRTGLLDNGEECQTFPINVDFDTDYRMAIDVDRDNSIITFRLNGERHAQALPVTLFAAGRPFARVEMGSYDGGTVLGSLDDVRNSDVVLTATELSAGSEVPLAFPPEPSDEDRQVDSSLDALFDYAANHNYIDDFESGTTAIGLSRFPRESTLTSIGHFDGALEIQTTSEDPDRGSSSELRINAPSDTVSVVASISDRSTLQPGQTEVSFDVDVTLMNDTQDGGFNDREGDVQARLRFRVDGSGERRIRAELRRRDDNGDNNRLEVFDGDDRFDFALIPQLNTPYEFGISLDREQGTITFSVDDLSRTVQLPFQAFQPAEREVKFQSWFSGISGRSVVRIHSLTVGEFSQDFSTQAPTIAPYAPAWNARYAGVDVDYVDGRVRLSQDTRITDRNADIWTQGSPEFIGADIELSTESVIASESAIAVGLSGTLYHDTPPADLNDRTGAVFVALRLTANSAGERFVQTCAFRSGDDRFSSSLELITGEVGSDGYSCQRMATVPEFDTSYPASVQLDKEAATLTFRFADEEFVYNITGEIHPPARAFAGARTRAQEGSKTVAYIDNLAFASDPVPLALSDFGLGGDITAEVNAGSNIANAPDPTEDSSDNNNGSSSSGGGGAWSFPIILLLLCLFTSSRAARAVRYRKLCN